jgi:hypothetical protein
MGAIKPNGHFLKAVQAVGLHFERDFVKAIGQQMQRALP